MLLDFFEINPVSLLQDMSYEENKCIYLISALLKEPEVLVLDEPYNFLDTARRIKLNALLKTYIKSGNTVIVTTTDFAEIAPICTRFSAIQDKTLIRRDEIASQYQKAKEICILGLNPQDTDLLVSFAHIIPLNLVQDKKVFIYMSDMDSLCKLLNRLRFSDIYIKDLTIQEQIFKQYHFTDKELN